jgi:N6-L-threonylcarbamoyladenine synthase
LIQLFATKKEQEMLVLGIETSCDETSVAILNDRRAILAHHIYSQIEQHQMYGGVVPEIASRAHGEILPLLLKKAQKEAQIKWEDLDVVAATAGPGLIGGVMIGMLSGKSLAYALQKKFVAVNHLEGHVLSPRIEQEFPFPYLVLLVSGGHTQILLAKDIGDYEMWGTTQDDAVGECIDKSAKMMGLPYPGGKYLEELAREAEDHGTNLNRSFDLPVPRTHDKDMHFSFSGLKTAVRSLLDAERNRRSDGVLSRDFAADLAFQLQNHIAKILCKRLEYAFEKFHSLYPQTLCRCALVGGVAANQTLRQHLDRLAAQWSVQFHVPSKIYCTDNAAMIAWAGLERAKKGLFDGFDHPARPRWPLEDLRTG